MRKKQAEPGGLALDKPRLQSPGSHPAFELGFYILLVLLGGLGALACTVTAFQLPVQAAPLVLVALLYGVLGVLQVMLPRGRAIVFAGGALLWGGALLLFSADCALGANRVLNQMILLYSQKLHFALRQFAVPEATPQEAAYTCTLFVAMLLPPFFWALSWVLARQKNPLGAFSLTGAVLSLSMALSILPEFWALFLLLLFWGMLLLSGTVLGHRHRLLDERGRFVISAPSVRPMALALLPLLALCMLLVYKLFPEETYTRPRIANDLRAGIQHGFGLDALMQGGQASSNDRVALDALKGRSYSGKTMLRVKYDWGETPRLGEAQQKDYLKNFVGSVYTGRSWERLDSGGARALQELVRPGQVQALQSEIARLLPSPEYDNPLNYTVEIENTAANPRCIYTPYGLSPLGQEELSEWGLGFVDDAFMESPNLFSGSRNYTFRAKFTPVANISYEGRVYMFWAQKLFAEADASFWESYWKAAAADPYNMPHITDVAEPYKALYKALTGLEADEAASRQAEFPAWALSPLEPEAQELAALLDSYRQFVFEHYVQLPEESARLLENFRQENGLDFPKRGEGETLESQYEDYINRICGLFQENYSYTLAPPVTPADRDFAAFFLEESKTGYCVHFATAATALCRSAGIPARYVEGYVVPSGQNGSWVDVPDRNAHAWLEVYFSGTGWVRYEVTPVSPDAPATYYNAQVPPGESGTGGPEGEEASNGGDGDASPSPSPTAAPTAAPTPSAAPSAGPSPVPEGGGSGAAGGSPLRVLLIILGGLLAVPLCLWGVSLARRYRRRKAFTQADRSKAALCLYAHLLKLHKEEALQYYGERRPPEHWEQLALKARFGREMVTPEELGLLAADAAKLEGTLRRELPTGRKIYCRYIKGLF